METTSCLESSVGEGEKLAEARRSIDDEDLLFAGFE